MYYDNFTVGKKKHKFYILSHALSFCIKNDLRNDFDFLFTKVEKRNDITQVVKTCVDIENVYFLEKLLDIQFLTAQDKVFFLKKAINENKIECLKIFLYQPSLGITPNVDFLSFPISRCFNEVVYLLIKDNRVNINVNDKISFKIAKSTGNIQVLEYLSGSKQNITKDKFNSNFSSLKFKNSTNHGHLECLSQRSLEQKDLKIIIKLPFGEPFILNVQSQFRTCDMYKYLRKKCSHNFTLFDNSSNIIDSSDNLVTELAELVKNPVVNVVCIFETNSHEPFQENVKIYYPDLLNKNSHDAKLADILTSDPDITLEEIKVMSEIFNCHGLKKEFIKQKKGEIPDLDFFQENLSHRDINEIVDDFFQGKNKPDSLSILFSLKEFDVKFLEKLAMKAIEKDFPGVLRSCGNHCLWRGNSVENLTLLAVEKSNVEILKVLLSLPDVNPGVDESITAIAAIAFRKNEHLDILLKDPRVKIHEDGPVVHATRYGMTDLLGFLI